MGLISKGTTIFDAGVKDSGIAKGAMTFTSCPSAISRLIKELLKLNKYHEVFDIKLISIPI